MSDATSTTASVTAAAPAAADVLALPATLRRRLNGQLDGRQVVAWSEFDLNSDNQYGQHYALLTDRELLVFDAEKDGAVPKVQAIELESIGEAKVVEGLGVDRLDVFVGDHRAAQMRYTYRHRRGMSRLHRKLERRLPKKEGQEIPPDWLESVERRTEVDEICKKCGERIPTYAEGVCPRCLHQRKILWRLLDEARPYRPRLWLALALTILVSALNVLPPIFVKHLIDNVAALRFRPLITWSALMVGTFVASEAVNAARLLTLSIVGTRITADLRHKVYAHLHELSLRYFAKRRTGSLITRVTNDTDRLWDFIVFGSVDFFRNCVMILFLASAMLYENWLLAVISLVPLPVLAAVSYYRGIKMQRMFGRLWTYWSRMTAVVGDAIPGVKVVKAFGNERREVTRFDSRSDEYANKEIEIHWIWTALAPTVSGIMKLGQVVVWLVGGFLVIRAGNKPGGSATIGTLVMFSGFVSQFYVPIMELANSNRMVTRAATSAQRVFEVLDTPPDIFSHVGAFKKDKLEGRVEFRHVAFSYEGAQPALRDISLIVEPGQMIGLCGPSGAGKSTFVNLICRFYDATDGQLLIDDVDIRDYDVHWLRRQVGIVLQEPYLFHGTVTENIRYGNPDASEAEVIAAAKAANAHNFIVGFPDGYDTMVGERGQSLSGGERQRISIARAILHNPRILILDEATSSVDSETEKQIQEALDRLVSGRTTIAIAHRLSTLQSADRLVVLEKGKIAEEGTHDELVNKEGGVYAKLHKTQMEMASLVAIR
jgi:ATP-binding cassette subfamily B protein